MTVGLVSITPNTEATIAYLARVSSSNQGNPEYAGLIRYLIEHQHWSPFEMAHAVVEIHTSRAIAQQLLRHRSFSFQELSQRYAAVQDKPRKSIARKQAVKNRQSSLEPLDTPEQAAWETMQEAVFDHSWKYYEEALKLGVSREQARMLLPLATPTRLYMAGSIRSWMHYIALRTQPDTQHEHREIAEQCRDILAKELPVIAQVMGWGTDT